MNKKLLKFFVIGLLSSAYAAMADSGDPNMGKVLIQIQEASGNWRTISVTENQDQVIARRLDEAVRSYRTRARAVDGATNITIDIRN